MKAERPWRYRQGRFTSEVVTTFDQVIDAAEPLGKRQPEAVEGHLLGSVRRRHTSQVNGTFDPVGPPGRQDHIAALDLRELLHRRPRRIAELTPPLPISVPRSRGFPGAAGLLGRFFEDRLATRKRHLSP